MQDSDTPDQAATAEVSQKRVELQKIYVKDISYEAPGTPQIFTGQWIPQVSQEMRNSHAQIGEDVFESVLTITITAKIDGKVAYLIEVSQAGIFSLPGHTPEGLEKAFAIFCPTILFPYAREAISDLSTRGGFPSLVLQNINFYGLYDEYQKGKEAARAKTGDNSATH